MNHGKEGYIANHITLELGHRKFAVRYTPRLQVGVYIYCRLPLTSVSGTMFSLSVLLVLSLQQQRLHEPTCEILCGNIASCINGAGCIYTEYAHTKQQFSVFTTSVGLTVLVRHAVSNKNTGL